MWPASKTELVRPERKGRSASGGGRCAKIVWSGRAHSRASRVEKATRGRACCCERSSSSTLPGGEGDDCIEQMSLVDESKPSQKWGASANAVMTGVAPPRPRLILGTITISLSDRHFPSHASSARHDVAGRLNVRPPDSATTAASVAASGGGDHPVLGGGSPHLAARTSGCQMSPGAYGSDAERSVV